MVTKIPKELRVFIPRIQQMHPEHESNRILQNIVIFLLIRFQKNWISKHPMFKDFSAKQDNRNSLKTRARDSGTAGGRGGSILTYYQKLTSCLGCVLSWYNVHPCLYSWVYSYGFDPTVAASIEWQREAIAGLKPTWSNFIYVIIEVCITESLTSNMYWL